MSASVDPFFGLSYGWTLGEAGWNVGMDANLLKLGVTCQLAVKSKTTQASGVSTPVAGDRYIVPASATGAWAGKDGQIAYYINSAWAFLVPYVGWKAYVQDVDNLAIYKGSSTWSTYAIPSIGAFGATLAATTDVTAAHSALGLVNHEKVSVDSAGVADLRGVVSRGVAGFIPYIKSRADGSAFGYLDGDYEVANYGWIFGQNNLNGDLRLYRRSAGTSNIEVMNIVRDGVDGGKVYFANAAQFGGKVGLGGTISQHQYFYPGVGSFNVGYDYSSGEYTITSDGGGTLNAAHRLTISMSGKTTIFGQLVPGTDNAHPVGSTGERWSTAYLATNPVVGSDARLKCDYSVIPGDIAHELMLKIVPRVGKFIVGGQEAYQEDEDYEEQVQVTELVDVRKTAVQVIDGKAVQVTTTETVQQPVYDEFPLVDGDGNPVMRLVTPVAVDDGSGKVATPAAYERAVHREPRMEAIKKTRKVTHYREVPGTRYHTYYLAHEVKAALDSVADRWPQAANLALWLLSNVEDVDSIQMIRYEQMIPIIHAATVYQWRQK